VGAVSDEVETATAARQRLEVLDRLIKTEAIATNSKIENVAAKRIDGKNMSIDEISEPIQTPLGFHIIQLTAIAPPRQMSF